MSEYRLPGGTGRSVVEKIDCVQAMKQYPDGYFDLAVVDPPYGGGGKRSGAGTGRGSVGDSTDTSRYKRTEQAADGRLSSAKKLWPGTTRRARSILMSCFAFPSSRSSGAGTTLSCRRADAF